MNYHRENPHLLSFTFFFWKICPSDCKKLALAIQTRKAGVVKKYMLRITHHSWKILLRKA